MTTRKRADLAKEFRDGERPSGQDFADLIESCLNKSDDGLSLDAELNLELPSGMRLGYSTSTSAGTLRFDTGKVQFHNGTTWLDVASGSSGAFQQLGSTTAVAYASGNVGIGPFTPVAPPKNRLEVELGPNAGEGDRVRFGNVVCSNGPVGSESSAQFSHRNFSTNAGFALRQDPSGAVIINAPTGQGVNVLQNGSTPVLTMTASRKVVIGGASELIGANSATLQVAGAAYKNNGQSAWDITSDARLKDDIRDLELGLQHLVQVRPVRFRYNGKAGTPLGCEGVGIVGQEIEKIFPDMVRHVKNASPGELDDDDVLVYNASALTYVLVNAVKELAGKVQKLEAALALAGNNARASILDSI